MLMAQLLVRDLDPDLVDALKRRAAENGRSTEAEHRLILQTTLGVAKRRTLAEALMAMPNAGTDEDFARIEESEQRDVLN